VLCKGWGDKNGQYNIRVLQMKNELNKLREIYDNLPKVIYPKMEFIDKIARGIGVSRETVIKWVYEGVMPRAKLHCMKTAEVLEMSVDDIFPQFKAYYRRQQ